MFSFFRHDYPEWLVVGLGNPGAQYANTRHNVGYMVVDDLLAENGDMLVKGRAERDDMLLFRADSYMNDSGVSVARMAKKMKADPDHIIVVHDELDLPPNKIKLRKDGSENGHNGLKSISEHLGSRGYYRVKVGIGRTDVLGPVDATAQFDEAIALAARAVHLIVEEGLAIAQNEVHAR